MFSLPSGFLSEWCICGGGDGIRPVSSDINGKNMKTDWLFIQTKINQGTFVIMEGTKILIHIDLDI